MCRFSGDYFGWCVTGRLLKWNPKMYNEETGTRNNVGLFGQFVLNLIYTLAGTWHNTYYTSSGPRITLTALQTQVMC